MSEAGKKSVGIFKAQKQTNRFNKNQRVWVVMDFGNHLRIAFKWRGRGRYVSGTIAKWNHTGTWFNPAIGGDGIKQIDVDESFAAMLRSIAGL